MPGFFLAPQHTLSNFAQVAGQIPEYIIGSESDVEGELDVGGLVSDGSIMVAWLVAYNAYFSSDSVRRLMLFVGPPFQNSFEFNGNTVNSPPGWMVIDMPSSV